MKLLCTPEHLREISRLTSGNRDLYRNACADAAAQIERLQERVAVLEAELRVAYKLPSAIERALDGASQK